MGRKKILLFLILFSINHIHAQKTVTLKSHSTTTKRLLALIREDSLLSTSAISVDGSPSKPFYRFYYLMNLIQPEGLIKMTNDPSGYLRIYGYIGLLHLGHQKAEEIKQVLLQDSSYVRTMAGCVRHRLTISDAVQKIDTWYQRNWFDTLANKYVTKDYVFSFTKKELLVK